MLHHCLDNLLRISDVRRSAADEEKRKRREKSELNYKLRKDAAEGNAGMVLCHLWGGADVNSVDKHGRTALTLAFLNKDFGGKLDGFAKTVTLLLEYGASAHFVLGGGIGLQPALVMAIFLGHLDIAGDLLNQGAVLPDYLLIAAAAVPDVPVTTINFLLQNGADVNAQLEDYHGTALFKAVENRNKPVIQALLAAGAEF